jgi:hypothetical protein
VSAHVSVSLLRDHAAGASLPPSVGDHVGVCAECTAVLETERRLLAEVDDVLGGVRDSHPSPAFVARVRALAVAPASPRWSPPQLFWAAAALALALTPVALRLAAPPQPSVPSADRSPRASAPSAPVMLASVPPSNPTPAPSRRPRRRAAPPAEPIVPSGQETLIVRFAALVDSGAVEARAPTESDVSQSPLPSPQELYLPPLSLAPLEADEAPSED